jgi:hypothetical protein
MESVRVITQVVYEINLLIFLEKLMTLVLSELSKQHTNRKWNPSRVVEVYR